LIGSIELANESSRIAIVSINVALAGNIDELQFLYVIGYTDESRRTFAEEIRILDMEILDDHFCRIVSYADRFEQPCGCCIEVGEEKSGNGMALPVKYSCEILDGSPL
jgi:hypothetical protein